MTICAKKTVAKILNNNLVPDISARLLEAFSTLSLMDGGGGTDNRDRNSSFETLFLSSSFNLRGGALFMGRVDSKTDGFSLLSALARTLPSSPKASVRRFSRADAICCLAWCALRLLRVRP